MLEQQIGDLRYLIRYPEGYTCQSRYPVLIFLHGAGTRGNDMSLLETNPFFRAMNTVKYPFIIVAPLCSADSWFDVFENLIHLTQTIYNAEFTDKAHFYAIGASMGGYGVWQLAMSCPTLFTAIVPICGGGMYWNASRLKDIPVWAFHGRQDTTVLCEESVKMVNAVNQCGGRAMISIYEDCGHDAWTSTYANAKVFDWLLENERK